jgi:hypothetical protein
MKIKLFYMLFLLTLSHGSYAMEEGASLTKSAITETAAQEARLNTDAILAKHGVQRFSNKEVVERKAEYFRNSLRLLQEPNEAQSQTTDMPPIVPPLNFDAKALESASQKLELLQGIANPMLTERSQPEKSSEQVTPRQKESMETPRGDKLAFILAAASLLDPSTNPQDSALIKPLQKVTRKLKSAEKTLREFDKLLVALQGLEKLIDQTQDDSIKALGQELTAAKRSEFQTTRYANLHVIHECQKKQDEIFKELEKRHPRLGSW